MGLDLNQLAEWNRQRGQQERAEQKKKAQGGTCNKCGADIVWMPRYDKPKKANGKPFCEMVDAWSTSPGENEYDKDIHSSHYRTCSEREKRQDETPEQIQEKAQDAFEQVIGKIDAFYRGGVICVECPGASKAVLEVVKEGVAAHYGCTATLLWEKNEDGKLTPFIKVGA